MMALVGTRVVEELYGTNIYILTSDIDYVEDFQLEEGKIGSVEANLISLFKKFKETGNYRFLEILTITFCAKKVGKKYLLYLAERVGVGLDLEGYLAYVDYVFKNWLREAEGLNLENPMESLLLYFLNHGDESWGLGDKDIKEWYPRRVDVAKALDKYISLNFPKVYKLLNHAYGD